LPRVNWSGAEEFRGRGGSSEGNIWLGFLLR